MHAATADSAEEAGTLKAARAEEIAYGAHCNLGAGAAVAEQQCGWTLWGAQPKPDDVGGKWVCSTGTERNTLPFLACAFCANLVCE